MFGAIGRKMSRMTAPLQDQRIEINGHLLIKAPRQMSVLGRRSSPASASEPPILRAFKPCLKSFREQRFNSLWQQRNKKKRIAFTGYLISRAS